MLAPIFGEDALTSLDVQYLIDPFNKTLPVEEVKQLFIHLGRAFRISQAFSILAGASAYFLVTIPVGTTVALDDLHLSTVTGPMELELFESPTKTVAGTPVTPVNLNRVTPYASVLTIEADPTITVDGSRLIYSYLPVGHKDGGEGGKGFSGWLLKEDTEYLLKFTNQDTSTAIGGVVFEWLENVVI